MLQKLRSRHPIDLPRGHWAHKRKFLGVLGILAVLFVIVPLLLSPLVALSASVPRVAIAVAAGVGTLVLVLLVGGVRGKTGWDR
jgi:hypothetical protein